MKMIIAKKEKKEVNGQRMKEKGGEKENYFRKKSPSEIERDICKERERETGREWEQKNISIYVYIYIHIFLNFFSLYDE